MFWAVTQKSLALFPGTPASWLSHWVGKSCLWQLQSPQSKVYLNFVLPQRERNCFLALSGRQASQLDVLPQKRSDSSLLPTEFGLSLDQGTNSTLDADVDLLQPFLPPFTHVTYGSHHTESVEWDLNEVERVRIFVWLEKIWDENSQNWNNILMEVVTHISLINKKYDSVIPSNLGAEFPSYSHKEIWRESM